MNPSGRELAVDGPATPGAPHFTGHRARHRPVIARLTRDGRILINDRHPFGTWWHDGTAYCAKVPLAWIVGVGNRRQLRRLIASVVRESPRWAESQPRTRI